MLLAAGWYGRDLVGVTSRYLRRRHQKALMSKEIATQNDMADWAMGYYVQRGQDSYIFKLENGKPIPYLTREEWRFRPGQPLSVAFNYRPVSSPVKVNNSYIRTRKKLGQRVWNGNIYCLLDGISGSAGSYEISIGTGTYFQYITVTDHLEGEGRACLRNSRRDTDYRDKVALTIAHLQSARPGAQLVGFTVAVVMRTQQGPVLLVQTRSVKTGVAGGRQALVPAYVCEPNPDASEVPNFPISDFFREFVEELYIEEEPASDSLISRYWYYDYHPIPELLDLQGKGDFVFEILGYGFDALTTELHVGAVAYIHSIEFSERELRRMRKSWEADGIEIVPVTAAKIARLAEAEPMYSTSAFTLLCLKSWLTERGYLSVPASART